MPPVSPTPMKPCAGCGKEMPKSRGVCHECGHMSTWFKVRFFVGGAFILLGFLSLLAMMVLALMGGGN